MELSSTEVAGTYFSEALALAPDALPPEAARDREQELRARLEEIRASSRSHDVTD